MVDCLSGCSCYCGSCRWSLLMAVSKCVSEDSPNFAYPAFWSHKHWLHGGAVVCRWTHGIWHRPWKRIPQRDKGVDEDDPRFEQENHDKESEKRCGYVDTRPWYRLRIAFEVVDRRWALLHLDIDGWWWVHMIFCEFLVHVLVEDLLERHVVGEGGRFSGCVEGCEDGLAFI